MSREFLQKYFEELCELSRAPMSTEERRKLREERTRVAILLAFAGGECPQQ